LPNTAEWNYSILNNVYKITISLDTKNGGIFNLGKLTTHILDLAHGCPAAGVRIELYGVSHGDGFAPLGESTTNEDGRCDKPILEGDDFTAGAYELRFHVGAYFASKNLNLPDLPFLDVVPIRFGISAPGDHYHVPLLVSPYAYSTYRGS
jgi:5-hydroxyisourate hydrolase